MDGLHGGLSGQHPHGLNVVVFRCGDMWWCLGVGTCGSVWGHAPGRAAALGRHAFLPQKAPLYNRNSAEWQLQRRVLRGGGGRQFATSPHSLPRHHTVCHVTTQFATSPHAIQTSFCPRDAPATPPTLPTSPHTNPCRAARRLPGRAAEF
eukprot:351841-Chlamydomonas_euryale.AAC.7